MTKAHIRILLDELRARIADDSGYSMREFARDIGISVSSVSQILSGKQLPAPKLADRIVNGLSLSPELQREFYESLRESGMRSRLAKRIAEAEQGGENGKQLLSKEEGLILALTHFQSTEFNRRSIGETLPMVSSDSIDWAIGLLEGAGFLLRVSPENWRAHDSIRLFAEVPIEAKVASVQA